MELFGGMREACDEYALWLVGGNLSRGREVSIAVTVTGEVAPGHAVLRSGARAGDPSWSPGALGGRRAGLRDGPAAGPPKDGDRASLRRHFRPVARVGEAAVLARHAARPR